MKFISLFAGIGGFDLALSKLNHQCVYANDNNKYCKVVYDNHFPKQKLDNTDIRKVEAENIPDHELLVGGFPCQSFSIAGRRHGFADTRGTMFFEVARIIAKKQPRLLLLENVKGLLSHDKGNTFGTILGTLDELGYDTQWQVLNSKNFGVPQNRERVFIVGHLRGSRRPEVFPIRSENRVIHKNFIAIDHGKLVKRDIANCLDANYFKGLDNHQQRTGVLKGVSIRRLTPTECERLQGFPDNWTKGVSDTQRYKQMGNAVTVNVVYEIAKRLI